MALLLMSGIEPNPGPPTRRVISRTSQKNTDVCGVCHEICNWEQQSLACDSCDQWIHRRCSGVSIFEYYELSNSNDQWTCAMCNCKEKKKGRVLRNLRERVGLPNYLDYDSDTDDELIENSASASDVSDGDVDNISLSMSSGKVCRISTTSLSEPITCSNNQKYSGNDAGIAQGHGSTSSNGEFSETDGEETESCAERIDSSFQEFENNIDSSLFPSDGDPGMKGVPPADESIFVQSSQSQERNVQQDKEEVSSADQAQSQPQAGDASKDSQDPQSVSASEASSLPTTVKRKKKRKRRKKDNVQENAQEGKSQRRKQKKKSDVGSAALPVREGASVWDKLGATKCGKCGFTTTEPNMFQVHICSIKRFTPPSTPQGSSTLSVTQSTPSTSSSVQVQALASPSVSLGHKPAVTLAAHRVAEAYVAPQPVSGSSTLISETPLSNKASAAPCTTLPTASPSSSQQASTVSTPSSSTRQGFIMYDPGKDSFKCLPCGFVEKGNAFIEHLMCQVLPNPYYCPYCPKAFAERATFHKHCELMHPKEKRNCKLKQVRFIRSIMDRAKADAASGKHTPFSCHSEFKACIRKHIVVKKRAHVPRPALNMPVVAVTCNPTSGTLETPSTSRGHLFQHPPMISHDLSAQETVDGAGRTDSMPPVIVSCEGNYENHHDKDDVNPSLDSDAVGVRQATRANQYSNSIECTTAKSISSASMTPALPSLVSTVSSFPVDPACPVAVVPATSPIERSQRPVMVRPRSPQNSAAAPQKSNLMNLVSLRGQSASNHVMSVGMALTQQPYSMQPAASSSQGLQTHDPAAVQSNNASLPLQLVQGHMSHASLPSQPVHGHLSLVSLPSQPVQGHLSNASLPSQPVHGHLSLVSLPSQPVQGHLSHVSLPSQPVQGHLNLVSLPSQPVQGRLSLVSLPSQPVQGHLSHVSLPSQPVPGHLSHVGLPLQVQGRLSHVRLPSPAQGHMNYVHLPSQVQGHMSHVRLPSQVQGHLSHVRLPSQPGQGQSSHVRLPSQPVLGQPSNVSLVQPPFNNQVPQQFPVTVYQQRSQPAERVGQMVMSRPQLQSLRCGTPTQRMPSQGFVPNVWPGVLPTTTSSVTAPQQQVLIARAADCVADPTYSPISPASSPAVSSATALALSEASANCNVLPVSTTWAAAASPAHPQLSHASLTAPAPLYDAISPASSPGGHDRDVHYSPISTPSPSSCEPVAPAAVPSAQPLDLTVAAPTAGIPLGSDTDRAVSRNLSFAAESSTSPDAVLTSGTVSCSHSVPSSVDASVVPSQVAVKVKQEKGVTSFLPSVTPSSASAVVGLDQLPPASSAPLSTAASRVPSAPSSTDLAVGQAHVALQKYFVKYKDTYACLLCRERFRDINTFYVHVWKHQHGDGRRCIGCSRNPAAETDPEKLCSATTEVVKTVSGAITDAGLLSRMTEDCREKLSRRLLQGDTGDPRGRSASGDAPTTPAPEVYSPRAGGDAPIRTEETVETVGLCPEESVVSHPPVATEGWAADREGLEANPSSLGETSAPGEADRLADQRPEEDLCGQAEHAGAEGQEPCQGGMSAETDSQEFRLSWDSSPEHLTAALPPPREPPRYSRSEVFFVCAQCEFSCHVATDFITHLESEHYQEQFFPCYHCNYQGLYSTDLSNHIRAHTSGDSKIYSCPCAKEAACSFRTDSLRQLCTHILGHPSDAFWCGKCSAVFQSDKMLVRHLGENSMTLFMCSKCSSCFMEKQAIQRHWQDQHQGGLVFKVLKMMLCKDRKENNYCPPTDSLSRQRISTEEEETRPESSPTQSYSNVVCRQGLQREGPSSSKSPQSEQSSLSKSPQPEQSSSSKSPQPEQSSSSKIPQPEQSSSSKSLQHEQFSLSKSLQHEKSSSSRSPQPEQSSLSNSSPQPEQFAERADGSAEPCLSNGKEKVPFLEHQPCNQLPSQSRLVGKISQQDMVSGEQVSSNDAVSTSDSLKSGDRNLFSSIAAVEGITCLTDKPSVPDLTVSSRSLSEWSANVRTASRGCPPSSEDITTKGTKSPPRLADEVAANRTSPLGLADGTVAGLSVKDTGAGARLTADGVGESVDEITTDKRLASKAEEQNTQEASSQSADRTDTDKLHSNSVLATLDSKSKDDTADKLNLCSSQVRKSENQTRRSRLKLNKVQVEDVQRLATKAQLSREHEAAEVISVIDADDYACTSSRASKKNKNGAHTVFVLLNDEDETVNDVVALEDANNEEPVRSIEQSGANNEEPVRSIEQPGANNKEPVRSVEQSGANNEEPVRTLRSVGQSDDGSKLEGEFIPLKKMLGSEEFNDLFSGGLYRQIADMYHCLYCDKAFRSQLKVQMHLFVHYDVHVMKCTLCRFGYSMKEDLAKHFLAEHPGEEKIGWNYSVNKQALLGIMRMSAPLTTDNFEECCQYLTKDNDSPGTSLAASSQSLSVSESVDPVRDSAGNGHTSGKNGTKATASTSRLVENAPALGKNETVASASTSGLDGNSCTPGKNETVASASTSRLVGEKEKFKDKDYVVIDGTNNAASTSRLVGEKDKDCILIDETENTASTSGLVREKDKDCVVIMERENTAPTSRLVGEKDKDCIVIEEESDSVLAITITDDENEAEPISISEDEEELEKATDPVVTLNPSSSSPSLSRSADPESDGSGKKESPCNFKAQNGSLATRKTITITSKESPNCGVKSSTSSMSHRRSSTTTGSKALAEKDATSVHGDTGADSAAIKRKASVGAAPARPKPGTYKVVKMGAMSKLQCLACKSMTLSLANMSRHLDTCARYLQSQRGDQDHTTHAESLAKRMRTSASLGSASRGHEEDRSDCSADTRPEEGLDDLVLPGRRLEKDGDTLVLPGKTLEKDSDNSVLPGRRVEKDSDNLVLLGRRPEKVSDNLVLPGRRPEKDSDITVSSGKAGRRLEEDGDKSVSPGKANKRREEDSDSDMLEVEGISRTEEGSKNIASDDALHAKKEISKSSRKFASGNKEHTKSKRDSVEHSREKKENTDVSGSQYSTGKNDISNSSNIEHTSRKQEVTQSVKETPSVYSCIYCEAVPHWQDLRRHLEKEHANCLNLVKCGHCHDVYSRLQGRLKAHTRSKHPGLEELKVTLSLEYFYNINGKENHSLKHTASALPAIVRSSSSDAKDSPSAQRKNTAKRTGPKVGTPEAEADTGLPLDAERERESPAKAAGMTKSGRKREVSPASSSDEQSVTKAAKLAPKAVEVLVNQDSDESCTSGGDKTRNQGPASSSKQDPSSAGGKAGSGASSASSSAGACSKGAADKPAASVSTSSSAKASSRPSVSGSPPPKNGVNPSDRPSDAGKTPPKSGVNPSNRPSDAGKTPPKNCVQPKPTVKPDYRFKCVECSKIYVDMRRLKEHLVEHMDYRSHMCCHCDKMFISHEQVKGHHLDKHPGKTYELKVTRDPSKEDKLNQLVKKCKENANREKSAASASSQQPQSSTSAEATPTSSSSSASKPLPSSSSSSASKPSSSSSASRPHSSSSASRPTSSSSASRLPSSSSSSRPPSSSSSASRPPSTSPVTGSGADVDGATHQRDRLTLSGGQGKGHGAVRKYKRAKEDPKKASKASFVLLKDVLKSLSKPQLVKLLRSHGVTQCHIPKRSRVPKDVKLLDSGKS